jgi:isopentenyl-diphosphate delta-isomerase
MVDAVHRRAAHEVGLTLRDVTLTLPQFRYRAVDASGIVENEICPVYVAYTDDEPRLNPDEVAEARWVDPADLDTSISATPWAFSPWLVLQAQQLELVPDARRRAS